MALEWLKKLFGGGKKEEAEMQAPQNGEQPANNMGVGSGGEQPMEDQEEGQESSENKQW